MSFKSGHKKVGGREKGTPNRTTQEARELAQSLLQDPEYQTKLRERLLAGKADRIELLLWQQMLTGSGATGTQGDLHEALTQVWAIIGKTPASSSGGNGEAPPHPDPSISGDSGTDSAATDPGQAGQDGTRIRYERWRPVQ